MADRELQNGLCIEQESARRWKLPFGSPYFGELEIAAVSQALREGHVATGVLVERFEAAFAEKLGHVHAIACSSGSMANFLAVAALCASGRARPGDRVLVAGATFITAVAPVAQHGLVPVFVDIAPGSINTDLDALELAIERWDAVAVMIPHTLGQPLDLERLSEIKRRHRIALVEDCCESLGATWGSRAIGTTGDLATFSFFAGHHLTTGEGGMLVTGDAELESLVRSLRAFGRDLSYHGARLEYPINRPKLAPEERYLHWHLGYNGKLSDIQAAMGIVQLGRLDHVVAKRREFAAMLQRVVRGVRGVRLRGDAAQAGCSPFALVIQAETPEDRQTLGKALYAHGIDVRGFLGASLAHQPCFDNVPKHVNEPYVEAPTAGECALLLGCPPGVDVDGACTALARGFEMWFQSRRSA